MSKKSKMSSKVKKDFTFVKKVGEIEEYTLTTNGLTILYQNRPETGVVTTNITYKVGARDEQIGHSGLAHMLEHMLFKSTAHDRKKGVDSGAMDFERKTGSVLNANTWKDRTTYYFSYPKEHTDWALRVESERMLDTVIDDKELLPERNNVLSEFDMYNGMPEFALAVTMTASAFHSHPYGHETIGYRQDIENYTSEKLSSFYKMYYRPDNATLMIVGDIDKDSALSLIHQYFAKKKNSTESIARIHAPEPKQEGLRRVTINRDVETRLLSIGFKHAGFPSREWFTTHLLTEILTGNDDSILQKELVDTGLASSVEAYLEPTSETNLGYINITTPKESDLASIEETVLRIIRDLRSTDVNSLAKKATAKMLTDELFARENSLKIVSELTEYVASGDWSAYYKTPTTLKSIKPKDVINAATSLFQDNNLVIGTFKEK